MEVKKVGFWLDTRSVPCPSFRAMGHVEDRPAAVAHPGLRASLPAQYRPGEAQVRPGGPIERFDRRRG